MKCVENLALSYRFPTCTKSNFHSDYLLSNHERGAAELEGLREDRANLRALERESLGESVGGGGKEEGRERRRTLKGKSYDRHHNFWHMTH